MDRGERHTGRLAHVDGAFLSQIHVVKVDEFKLRFLLWPTTTILKKIIEAELQYSLLVQHARKNKSSYVSLKCDKWHVS